MSEAAQAFAFVAKRTARRSMPASRWVHELSLELGWMTPAQARPYVQAAQDAGLLASDGEALRLTIDPATVSIQRGFRPDPNTTPAPASGPAQEPPPAEDGFEAWLRRICAATGKSASEILESVNAVQERYGGLLSAFPALLCIAREARMDVREPAETALDTIMRSAPGSAR